MKRPIRRPTVTAKDVLVHAAVIVAMLFLNFVLPQSEPVAFALFFAALGVGLNPYVCGAGYLLSSLSAFSPAASLSAAVQALFCVLVFALYRRFGKRPRYERVAYAAAAQLPFIFLFPFSGYALFGFSLLLQKTVIASFLLLLCFLFEGGLSALLYRAFRCRLSASRLAEICLLCALTELGALAVLPRPLFMALVFFTLLFAVVLTKNATALPAAVVLSLPLAVRDASLVPIALFTLYACAALLLLPYGRIASALSFTLLFLGYQALTGLYAQSAAQIALTLCSGLLPAAVVILLPAKWLSHLADTLLFYRERSLPRIAVNRNRRAIGQQLYEVSSLFREIETAFTDEPQTDDGSDCIKEKLIAALCTDCPHRRKCEKGTAFESMERLIAVGKAKGRVNLIDLPESISSACQNSAGMLFALNKLLAGYHRYLTELRTAQEGRRLLAEQAHGVSEILKDIALEQSEEYVFTGGERALNRALAAAGLVTSEIFLYGEGENLTVSLTLPANADAKTVCRAAERALHLPFTLAEKIQLNALSCCFVLRRKANYDAAFGIASAPKNGETLSGDTHSVLKIDERRFLVALSDGMGSGEDARSVSDRALNLLESFYKAKMPSDTVLSTVNRLIAYSSEERFSCLDLAAVNLDTGNADIVKIGSPAGYLLSDGELRVLEGESLPIGMLEAVHPATMRVTMKADDFLLFMSDGVSQAFGSTTDLSAYLSSLRPLNPQSLAEELLSSAMKRYRGKAQDDMTVLAVKLVKTA